MNSANNSPVSSHYESVQNNQHYYSVTSPSNSDGNHYTSPVISPGYWDTSSPYFAYNRVSPQSIASFRGSSNITTSEEIRTLPPSTPPHYSQAPALPTELGDQGVKGYSGKKFQKVKCANKEFLEKSSMDKEREKFANRRVQSIMLEVSRNRNGEYGKVSRQALGKKEANDFLVPNGTEAFATSSRKKKEPMIMEDFKGSVNDFKSIFDLDREKVARKHALRIITRLNNAA